MSVRVHINAPHNHIYTPLTTISGRAILFLPSDTTISHITAKLEGESRTQLAPQLGYEQPQKRVPLIELHKVLYQVQTLFPLQQITDGSGRGAQYTLSRGQYEYPFHFQVPIQTSCAGTAGGKNVNLGAVRVEIGNEQVPHLLSPLPPSMSDRNGEAEVRYYVKITVVRPKIWQENLRTEVPVLIFPLEKHGVLEQGQTYGRRRHQFQPYTAGVKRKGSLAGKVEQSAQAMDPLAFQVEVRLPSPAILTYQQPLPLSVYINKLNESTATIYLDMIQIELIGRTEIRAFDQQVQRYSNWLILSSSNMMIPLEQQTNQASQYIIPDRLWRSLPLPFDVIPSFLACNISRSYCLEIRIGLKHAAADGLRPEIIVSPIKLDIQVYSGWKPPHDMPAYLLEPQGHLGQQLPGVPFRMDGMSPTTFMPGAFPMNSSATHHHFPNSSIGSPHSLVSPFSYTTSGQPQAAPLDQTSGNDDEPPPPSYEDAIAEDVQVASGSQQDRIAPDPRRRPLADTTGLNRQGSERLFAQNNVQPPQGHGWTDQNRYGGDPVPAEALNQQNTGSTEYRPRLPVRRQSTQPSSGHKTKQ